MKKSILIVSFFLFVSCISKTDTTTKNFQIVFESRPVNEVILVLDLSYIEKIDWENQIYYLNKDSLFLFNGLLFGTGGENIVFMYNFNEIYRANVCAPYNSFPLYEDAALVETFAERGQRFKNDAISVTHLERAKLNKRLYKKAEKYLRKQGLLIE